MSYCTCPLEGRMASFCSAGVQATSGHITAVAVTGKPYFILPSSWIHWKYISIIIRKNIQNGGNLILIKKNSLYTFTAGSKKCLQISVAGWLSWYSAEGAVLSPHPASCLIMFIRGHWCKNKSEKKKQPKGVIFLNWAHISCLRTVSENCMESSSFWFFLLVFLVSHVAPPCSSGQLDLVGSVHRWSLVESLPVWLFCDPSEWWCSVSNLNLSWSAC